MIRESDVYKALMEVAMRAHRVTMEMRSDVRLDGGDDLAVPRDALLALNSAIVRAFDVMGRCFSGEVVNQFPEDRT